MGAEARAYIEAIRGYRHGDLSADPPAAPNPDARCQTCNDWHYVRLHGLGPADPRFGQLIPCPNCNEQTPEERRAYLLSASRLASTERGHVLGSYWTPTVGRQRALTGARELLERGCGWLTLWGGNGSGKSYLATAIVNAALEAERECRYWMLADLLDALRDAYQPGQGEADYSALVEELAALPLLVVDECAAFSPTPWAKEKLRQIAERRNRASDQVMSVWVCNVDPHGQGGDLDFLFSRMTEHTVVEVNDGDVRPELGHDWRNEP